MNKLHAKKSNARIVPHRRSLRRFIRELFASFLKRQKDVNAVEFQEDVVRLETLQEMIEIIAREMARQANRK